MKLIDALNQRHSVRRYVNKPLSNEAIDTLKNYINDFNIQANLHIRLILNEPKAFKGISSYGKFKGVENYIIMAADKCRKSDELIGYYGERLVLLAQQLGLNTCWVGMTYKKIPGIFSFRKDEKIHCVIAIGYGDTQGVNRKSKPIDKVSNANDQSPKWFIDGVKAVLKGPSAINQQKYYFRLTGRKTTDGKPIVEAMRKFSLVGFTEIDLGIAKLHFEIAAGKDNFEWQ